MKKYLSVFVIRFRSELQYVGAAVGGFLTQCFFGLLLIALYRALYEGKAEAVPISTTVTYVWLQQAFFRMLFSTNDELSQKIITGSVAYDLCRPLDPYTFYFFENLASRLSGSLLRAVPMLIFALVLPDGWNLSLPAGLPALLSFFLCLTLGLICTCAMGNLLSALVMVTLDTKGLSSILQMLIVTFSGNLMPLTLYPENWQSVVKLLPISQFLDTPIRLYTGVTPIRQLLSAAAVQTVWIFVLLLSGKYLWKRYQKKIVLQGG